jgi:peptidoglycan hydrolase-like protein with peptidoglycan-binding domain
MAAHPTIKMGSTGDAVKLAQKNLTMRYYDPGPVDAIFGAKTRSATKWYQSDHGLTADGIIGPKTWKGLDPPQIKKGSTGDAVKMLQKLLKDWGYDPGPVDGDFGANTLKAVKAFQADLGLQADGIVGPKTWAMLGS